MMEAHRRRPFRYFVSRWWHISAAGTVLLAALAIQVPEVFPSGGDPGHMVYLGQSRQGLLEHPPLVPAMAGMLHAVSLSSFAGLSLLVKGFAVLSLGVFCLALQRLTTVLASDILAGRVALVLAAANPMALYEVLWGGLAQFWGMAFACLAIAEAMRWGDSARPRMLTLAWLLLTWYAHWYTGVFAGMAVGTILVARRFWKDTDVRETLRLGGLAALGILPLLWIYVQLGQDLRLMDETRAIASLSYFPGFLSLFSKRPMIVVAVCIILLSAVTQAALRTHAAPAIRRLFPFTLAWAVGFLVLLAGTPSSLAGRAFYFVPLLLIPLASAAIADAVHQRRLAVSAVAATAAIVMAGSGLVAYHQDQAFFNPMGQASAAAFQDLRQGTGTTAVYSPISNVDAWWLEAVVGRPAASTDAARYYSRHSEVASLDAAMVLAAGEHVLDLGDLFVATSPERGHPAPISVWVREKGNPVPTLFLEEREAVLVRNGSFTTLGAPASVEGPAGEARWQTEFGRVSRTILWDFQGLHLVYEVPGGVQEIQVPVAAGWGGSLETWNHGLRHVWPKDTIVTDLQVAPSPIAVTPTQATFVLPASDGVARWTLVATDLAAGAEWEDTLDAAASHGIEAVYARQAPADLVARFDLDPSFTPRFRQGDVATWQRVHAT